MLGTTRTPAQSGSQPTVLYLQPESSIWQNSVERINGNTRAHQDEDGACDSGLVGRLGPEVMAVNVLDLLLVFVQDKNHGDTGPGYEDQTCQVRGEV